MIKQGGLFIGNPDTFFLIFQKKEKFLSLIHSVSDMAFTG